MATNIKTKVKEAESRVDLVDRLAKDVMEKQAQHYNQLLLDILLHHGIGVYLAVVSRIVKLQSAQFKEQYRVDDNPYSVLGLTTEAPDEMVRFAYLYWAKRYHPDHGGDGRLMARVNDAMERIALDRGWRAMALPEGSQR